MDEVHRFIVGSWPSVGYTKPTGKFYEMDLGEERTSGAGPKILFEVNGPIVYGRSGRRSWIKAAEALRGVYR